MRLLISHFFNEAYLLPWWLKHHREIFDHGVLIDYGSTDDSVAICRELVPTWEVVSSQNPKFDAIMCDFEVMQHEMRYPDAWKLALNVSEFLITEDIVALEAALTAQHAIAGVMQGALMADPFTDQEPDQAIPLVEQKNWGAWESTVDFGKLALPGFTQPTRSRMYHRYKIGAYSPGRHASHLPGQVPVDRHVAAIWWYGFSPWTDQFRMRKLQINSKRGDFDRRFQFGFHHEAERAELERRRGRLITISRPLTTSPQSSEVVEDLYSRIFALESEVVTAQSAANAAQRQVDDVKNSTSWRLTSPLRSLRTGISNALIRLKTGRGN